MKQEPEKNGADPLIDEVRQIRKKISDRFGNDVRRLTEHLRQVEQEHAERLVQPGHLPTGR